MKKIFKIFVNLLIILPLTFFLGSCEDPVPTDYIPQNFVEAVLFVGKPVQNIVLMKTQPVSDSFNYAKSLIRDATVKIIAPDREMLLTIAGEGNAGYYYEDQSYLVQPETFYRLEITLSDGTILTGSTITPGETKWVKQSPDTLQYPKDTLNPIVPDSLYIQWDSVPKHAFYLLSLRCLDTLDYGKHLIPETGEMNRRIERPWNMEEMYYEITEWGLIPNTKSAVVWLSFKWFGLQEVSIHVPDVNYLNWFLQHIIKRQYDPNLNSIGGNGFGVFGSASVISDTLFLLKNQP